MSALSLQKVSTNALWNVSTLAASMLVGLVVTGMAVRELGLEQYGYFGLITIMLAPLAMGGLGFTESLTKFTAEYIASGELYAAKRHTQTVFFMALLVGVCGAALVSLLGPLLLQGVFSVSASNIDEVRTAIYWVAASWVFQQIASVFFALAAGLHAYKQVAIANIISIFAISSIQVVMLLNGFGLKGFVAGLAIGNLIGLFWWGFTLKRIAQWVSLIPALDSILWKKSFHYGGWQTLGQVGGILASQSERFFLGVYLLPALLGVYNTVLKLEQAAYLVAYKMSEVLFPYFSSTSNSEKAGSAINWLRASSLTTVLGVSMLAPLIPFGKPLLMVWVGSEVADQSEMLLIFFAAGGMLGCATNSSYFFMLGHGKTRLTAALSVATGITTIIVAWVFLPRFGFAAAAWAGIAAMLVQVVALSVAVRRYFIGHISYINIFTWLYVPVLVGFGLAMAIKFLDIQSASWILVLSEYLVAGVGIWIVNMLISRLLPGSSVRWNDVSRIYQHFSSLLLIRK